VELHRISGSANPNTRRDQSYATQGNTTNCNTTQHFTRAYRCRNLGNWLRSFKKCVPEKNRREVHNSAYSPFLRHTCEAGPTANATQCNNDATQRRISRERSIVAEISAIGFARSNMRTGKKSPRSAQFCTIRCFFAMRAEPGPTRMQHDATQCNRLCQFATTLHRPTSPSPAPRAREAGNQAPPHPLSPPSRRATASPASRTQPPTPVAAYFEAPSES
jgi:hypothetical protein